MYSLHQFGYMILDRVRMETFVEALRFAVHPGDVVLDIGAGTGIFSLIACQLGASKVYAIESNALIELGPETAAANGFADKIVFIHDLSTNVTLPEKADVLIADLRGQLPFFNGNISSMADARKRLLKPGGIIIPSRDLVYATLVSSPETYRRHIQTPWLENAYNLDMSPALSLLLHTGVPSREESIEFLLPPQVWATVDYHEREDSNASGTLEWDVTAPGKSEFVCLWFESEFPGGGRFSTAPHSKSADVYGYAILPLERPIELEAGDHVKLTINANHVNGSYHFMWSTRVVANGKVKAEFKQGTFFAQLFSDVRKRAANYVPQANHQAHILKFVLNAMEEGASIGAIAAKLQAAFPQDYPELSDAIAKVGDLSASLSQ
jgi:type I protein arginine methyltransferase